MAVTRDDVAHIAGLARLAIADDRMTELVAQLNAILGHMEVLQQVDTRHVETTAQEGNEALPLRPDAGPRFEMHRRLDEMAPAMRDGFFLVPRLATHEDTSDAS
ncbi:MAG TPA: Asp-tRNA(Asn)/Glu-tRNA(Gln) amidotransferase subunit GatC [Gemmatimonadaceae bacterium]|nr:Asp-tRNA(Asn)/Glu-tRNA(Gln) amidotransferase subunit GatC [Gemmatimonadaceae bacterium]